MYSLWDDSTFLFFFFCHPQLFAKMPSARISLKSVFPFCNDIYPISFLEAVGRDWEEKEVYEEKNINQEIFNKHGTYYTWPAFIFLLV